MTARKSESLAKNFFLYSLGPWLSAFISFAATPLTTWLIVPEEFGKASMYTLTYSLLMFAALLGVDQSYIRFFYTANDPEKRALLRRSVTTSLSVGSVIILVILLFYSRLSLLLFDQVSFSAVSALAASLFFGIVDRYTMIIFRMKQQAAMYSLFTVLNSVLYLSFVVLFSFTLGRTFLTIVLSQTLAVTSLALLSLWLQRDFWLGEGASLRNFPLAMILRYALPFAPNALIFWCFQSMDRFAVKTWSNLESLGLYAAAFKFAAVLEIFRKSFMTFWTPVALKQYTENPNDRALYEKMFSTLCAASFLMCIGMIACKDIIIYVFDAKYRDAAMIMPFMIMFPVLFLMSEITVVGINFQKQSYWHLPIVSAAAAVNLIGVYLLVPSFGAKGAAMSTAIAYIVFFTGRTAISRRLFHVKYHLVKTYLMIAAVFAYALLSTFVRFGWMHAAATLALSALLGILYRRQYVEIATWGRNAASSFLGKRKAS